MANRVVIAKSRFISHLSGYERQLLTAAELAQISRDADTLRSIASLGLGSLSLFCEAIGLNRQGKTTEAEVIARQLIEQGPDRFKSKALILLANNRRFTDPDGALILYDRSRPLAEDPATAITIVKMRAVILSDLGKNENALQALEQGVSLLGQLRCNPPLYTDYLNSLAVECTNVGKLDQARRLCKITTASPWIKLFPGWQETADHLRKVELKGRTMRTNPRPRANVLKFVATRRCPPNALAASLRLTAGAVISELNNTRLLTCLTKLGSLDGPNLELMLRIHDLDPALAETFLREIDKRRVEVCGQIEC